MKNIAGRFVADLLFMVSLLGVLTVFGGLQPEKQVNKALASREARQLTSAKEGIFYGTGKASFFSVAPIQNIDAHSTELKSELNTTTNEIAFVVPMRSFMFKNGKMQEDFNDDYMQSDKYPTATYKGTIQNKIDWNKTGTYALVSKGTLTIHGVAKERTDTATATISNGKINIKGSFAVRVADHQIKIPTLVIKKIAEVVTVKFDEDYVVKERL